MITNSTQIESGANYIDVRDIIERVEELESTLGPSEESTGDDEAEREELAMLTALLDDLRGQGGDHEWKDDWYPVSLIRQSYFRTYAEELAEDIGAINKDAGWPNSFIDWDAAADALLIDYSEVEFDGVTYYFR